MPDGTAHTVPIGACFAVEKPRLQELIDLLRQDGYRTIGPRVADAAIVYDDVDSMAQLPLGVLDEQDGGRYRLVPAHDAGYFDHVVGPHSLKNFIFPPRERLQEFVRTDGQWQTQPPPDPGPPVAVLGVRSCDLHALAIQDRVFLEGPYVDPAYKARRERLFIVAINCRRAAATCFCHSMGTGPAVKSPRDLALTELGDRFVVEVGSEQGARIAAAANWSVASHNDIARAQAVPQQLLRHMHRRSTVPQTEEQPRPRNLDTAGIHDLLLGNLDHPRWKQVAERCLSCANCTMVCPTCFCSTVEEVTDLTGDHVERERTWASCFTTEHSHLSSGPVRKTTASRYRQWLTHKLASWIDQYGGSGCVGCGRCITWCPVGIDLTEEVAAIRGGDEC
ncbi:MAG: 4Fe-4S dicluster domain-containing protein [Planctomycetaceae bacterium]